MRYKGGRILRRDCDPSHGLPEAARSLHWTAIQSEVVTRLSSTPTRLLLGTASVLKTMNCGFKRPSTDARCHSFAFHCDCPIVVPTPDSSLTIACVTCRYVVASLLRHLRNGTALRRIEQQHRQQEGSLAHDPTRNAGCSAPATFFGGQRLCWSAPNPTVNRCDLLDTN